MTTELPEPDFLTLFDLAIVDLYPDLRTWDQKLETVQTDQAKKLKDQANAFRRTKRRRNRAYRLHSKE